MQTKEIQNAKNQDIFNVVSQYTLLKKVGSRSVGKCPFHDEKTPSFFVDTQKNTFKCFGCGEQGDPIKFLMLAKKIKFQEAVNILNNNQNNNYNHEPKKNINKTTNYKIDYIDNEIAEKYFTQYSKNNFLIYLQKQIPNLTYLTEIVKRFSIGTNSNGETLFFQRDVNGKYRTAQIIFYDPNTGKRDKNRIPKWLHKTLKINDFSLGQCFFGEFQLSFEGEKDKPIAIVEAPKTAAIMSHISKKFIWLACGGAENLGMEKFKILAAQKRSVILYPDFGKLERWQVIGKNIENQYKIDIKVSKYLENHVLNLPLEHQEKYKGCDLADFNFV